MSDYLKADFPDLIIGDEVAFVTLQDFNRLAAYNTSMPTGMYPGKVWKRRGAGDRWLLAETVEADDPDYVNIVWRDLRVTAPPSHR